MARSLLSRWIVDQGHVPQFTRQIPPAELGQGKIVVHYADGRIVTGGSQDFSPNKPTFHLFPAAAEPSGRAIEVLVKDLMTVVFVRDFAGDDFVQ